MPTDSGLTQIQDHAEQAVELLPKAHRVTTHWRALMRGLLGRRGAWADGTTLYVVAAGSTTPAMPDFVCDSTQLSAAFGAGAATIQAGAEVLQSAPSAALGDVALLRYDGTPVALDVTRTAAGAMLAAHELRELPSGLEDAQLIAIVEAYLGGAPSGAQELEGEFWALQILRRLSLAYGGLLDALGGLLGLARDGMTDPYYRDLLALAAAAGVGKGSLDELVRAAGGISGLEAAQGLEAQSGMVELYLHGLAPVGYGASLAGRRLLRRMVLDGIYLAITSADSTRPFVFGCDFGWHRIGNIGAGILTTDLIYIDAGAPQYMPQGSLVRIVNATTGQVEQAGMTVADTPADYEVRLTQNYTGTMPAAGVLLVIENEAGPSDDAGEGFEDAYPITVANTVNGWFQVAGDCSSEWAVGHRLRVIGSTANDGIRYVTLVHVEAGNTRLVVSPGVTSSVADGQLMHVSPGLADIETGQTYTTDIDSRHGELADEYKDTP